MNSLRLRTFIAGGGVAVTAGLLIAQGSALGADLPHTAFLGVLLGAVVGLLPDRTVVGRTTGVVFGLGAMWLGYALRAGVLPDIPLGRAIAAMIVVGLITAVAVASAGRLPLWSGLIGAGALIGAYETTFSLTPTAFVSESTTAVTTVLVSAALGLLVTTVVTDLFAPRTGRAEPPEQVAVPGPRASVEGIDLKTDTRTKSHHEVQS